MSTTFTFLTERDADVLNNVPTGVFDNAVDPSLVGEFLGDPRHHIAVALDGGRVVAFASAVHYVHPDEHAQFWINEIGTAEAYRRRGIARRLLGLLCGRARELGCVEVWVVTGGNNVAARGLYRSAGLSETEGAVMYSMKLG